MEVNGEDGSRLALKRNSKTVIGRGSGLTSDDRTVSCRHVLLETKDDTQTEPKVSFEVIGRNPIWVRRNTDGVIRVFRRSEKGEMELDDWFCVAAETPIWFNLKKVDEFEDRESELAESLGTGFDFEDVDYSGIDPVKEFGFLVMGHEFDCYAKKMIRDVRKWDWFLEERGKEEEEEDNDDEEDLEKKERRGGRKKRKKGERVKDDEDWTGESEDEKEIIAKARRVHKPKYSTRSKDRSKESTDKQGESRTSVQKKKKTSFLNEEDEETLGGFIVDDDDDDDEEEMGNEEEEEEEEFLEEDDDEAEE